MDAKELKKILNLLKGAGRIQLTGGYTVDTLVDDWMDGYKYASQQMPSVKRIREFIKRQRYVGECQMGDKMRKRHGKSAKEFYDQFADEVFYTDKNGNKIGLDIQTLWHFRTKDMLIEELQEEIKLLKSKI